MNAIDSYNVFLYHLISFILFQENKQKQLPHHQDFNQMFALSSFQIFSPFEKDKGFFNQFFAIANCFYQFKSPLFKEELKNL